MEQSQGGQAVNYTKGHKMALIKTVNSLPAKMRCLFCDSQQLEI